MTKQDYGTPLAFIRACEARFGVFAWDLAAHAGNHKTERFFTPEQDSLAQPWASLLPTGTLWLNPPFANIDPWAKKCALESQHRAGLILMLTPASIGTSWFAEHVHRKAMVLGLSPRLTFEGMSEPYPKDLMLSCYGHGFSGFDTWRWAR